jgi:uncharacterized protein YceH (UPF0502 family)
MELTDEAARVLGALMEKQRTVPDTYPMTLKGLVSACNQSSSRWPVVSYDEGTVQRTLDQLKADGLVRFVHPSHGERSTKFRQVLDEHLGLERDDAAVLCVLLLRGPQTGGELRTRSERLHGFGSVDEVEGVLRRLAARDEPLVRLLDRRAGEREARWVHLLAGEPDLSAVAEAPVRSAPPAAASALEARVAELEEKVARLEAALGDLIS